MKKPQIENSTIVYQGYCDLRVDTLKKDDQIFDFNVLVCKATSVCILGKTADNKYLVTTEYRHAVGKYLLSLPGGKLEKNEKPLQAAKREFLEETGYTATSFKILKEVYPLPALCDQKVFFVIAENIEKVQDQTLDPLEDISVSLLSEAQILEKIKTADVDAVFFTAFQLKNWLF